jgi:hypothetical protein
MGQLSVAAGASNVILPMWRCGICGKPIKSTFTMEEWLNWLHLIYQYEKPEDVYFICEACTSVNLEGKA